MSEHDEKEHSGGHSRGGSAHGGHGGGGAHEEHEGAPEWLISFADNVALMMGFFVILLAMNMKEPTTGGIGGHEQNGGEPNSRMLDAAIALREAFHNPVNIDSTNPREQPLVRRLKERRAVGETTSPGPDGDRHNQQTLRPGDLEIPCAVIPFDDGSAQLSPTALQTIAESAETLAGHRYMVDVRGNVSAAEAAATEDRGMRLSYDRAMAVATALEDNGLLWRQIRIVAGGDTNRITPRAVDRAGHRTNQRTELYRTEDLMPDDPYAKDASAAAER